MSIFELAKEKGYQGEEKLQEIEIWIRNKKHIHCEIFFSMFHKKWSLNNYLIDLKKLKKIEFDSKTIFYEEYDDALEKAIEEMLNKIK